MNIDDSEKILFENICRKPHRKMGKCFMTGKTCVYDELIERRLKDFELKKVDICNCYPSIFDNLNSGIVVPGQAVRSS